VQCIRVSSQSKSPEIQTRLILNILKVEHRLQSEDERSHHYLSSHTAVPIRRILENHLLTAHLQAINDMPNSGLDVMIDTDNFEDLARLFRLFMTVPDGLPCLKKCLRQSIIQRGGEINRAATDPGGADIIDVDGMDGVQGKGKGKLRLPTAAAQTLSMALKWVQDVLDLKDKFDQAWKKSFQSNRDLETAVNSVSPLVQYHELSRDIAPAQAFESFINLNMKSPEFISLFIDENLKKGLKGVRREQTFAFRSARTTRLGRNPIMKWRSCWTRQSLSSVTSQRRTALRGTTRITSQSAFSPADLYQTTQREACSRKSKWSVATNSRRSSRACSTT
jgi:hypothetical protein